MCGSSSSIYIKLDCNRVDTAAVGGLFGDLGELAKRALRWPKHHSNTAAVTTLEMESVRSRLLVRKLGFLKRMVRDGEGWCYWSGCSCYEVSGG